MKTITLTIAVMLFTLQGVLATDKRMTGGCSLSTQVDQAYAKKYCTPYCHGKWSGNFRCDGNDLLCGCL